jgi:hypothetical protein
MRRFTWLIMTLLLLAGTLTAQPVIFVNETLLNFGPVQVGDTAIATVNVANMGQNDLIVDASVTGNNFTLVGPIHFTVSPRGGPSNIPVMVECRFIPTADSMLYSGELRFASNDPNYPMVTVVLRGFGTSHVEPQGFDLLSPPNGAHIARLPIVLAWDALNVSEPVTYRVVISGENPLPYVYEVGSQTMIVLPPDFSPVEGLWYTWTVFAHHGNTETQANSSWQFVYGDTPPPPPGFHLLSPPDDIYLNTLSVTLTWQSLPGGEGATYLVYLMGPDSGRREPLSFNAGSAASFEIPANVLTMGQAYLWWVRAALNGDTTMSLEMWTFHLGEEPPPPPPTPHFGLVTPENNVELSGSLATFAWEHLSDGALNPQFTLFIAATDTMNGREMFTFNAGADTFVVVTLSEIERSATFVWWVVAHVGGPVGTEIYSDEIRRFTLGQITTGVTDIPNAAVASQLQITAVYPNPFNPQTHIEFNNPRAGNVKAEIFDVLGRKVATIVDGFLDTGRHNFTWRANGASGVYLLRVSGANGQVDIRRLIFAR